ncbi:MAG: hypothetical protein ACO3RV_02470, partial [Luteolibacter sp.]
TEFSSFVNPPGHAKTWADIDAAMWNLHPRSSGNGTNSGQTSHRGNFYRATYTDSRGGLAGTIRSSWTRTLEDSDNDGFSDHEGLMNYFVDYATNTWRGSTWSRREVVGAAADPNRQDGYGYKYLEFEGLYGGWGNANYNPTSSNLRDDFPETPTVAAINSGFNVDKLTFAISSPSDSDDMDDHAATQWRIAQILAPGVPGYVVGTPWRYEIESTWSSEEISSELSTFKFPLGVAQSGQRYRVRARHKDTNGNWSYWSDPVTFDAVAPERFTLIHYWNFNSRTPDPALSLLGGSTTFSGTVLYDDGQDFSGLNARNGDSAGEHLRVNDPLSTGTELRFDIPTTGFRDILIQYESRRSGSGAGTQIIDYTLDGGSSWLNHSSIEVADIEGEAVPVMPLDFSEISGVDNNADFGLRITFIQGGGGSAGNNRFDNLTVEGRPIVASFEEWRALHFNTLELSEPTVSGPDADPTRSGISNLLRYAIGLSRDESPVDDDGVSVIHRLERQGGMVYRFRYNPSAAGIQWQVQAANSPDFWSHILFDSDLSSAPFIKDGWVEIALPDSLDSDGTPDPQMFVRLKVSRN